MAKPFTRASVSTVPILQKLARFASHRACVVFISLLFGCLFISMLTPSNSHTYNCGEFIVCHQDSTCVPLVVGGPQFESTKALFYHVTLILMNNSSSFVTVAVFACSSVNWKLIGHGVRECLLPQALVCEPRGIRMHPSSAQVSRSLWGIIRRSLSFVLSGQAEVCAGVLDDVIRCVLSGSDGCVLGLGCADVGE